MENVNNSNMTLAWFNINRRCNNACDFCYASDSLVSNEEMALESAKKYVSLLKQLDFKKIILIGGEPTLYKGLEILINCIHESGMVCAVQTNGIAFADIDMLEKCISAGMDECCISIKGFTEDSYCRTTGTGNYERMRKAIFNAKALSYNMLYSYTLTKTTDDELKEISNGINELGLDNIYFQTVHPTFSSNDIYQKQDMQKWVDFYNRLNMSLEKTQVAYKFSINFPLCLFGEKTALDWLKRDILHRNTCQLIMATGVVFDTDLKILPCNMYVKKPFESEQNIAETSEQLRRMIEMTLSSPIRTAARKPPSDICAECYRWSQCHAGCPARWNYENADNVICGF
jgi:radical SAM protein with 4Fe4S-binding SPASM domain